MNIFPDHCARCQADLRKTSSIMSRFSTETLCGACERRERVHPRYQEAHDRELQEVKAGNMNYEGIGTPPELYQPVSQGESAAMAVVGKSVEEALLLAQQAGGSQQHSDNPDQVVFRFADGTGMVMSGAAPVNAVAQFA